MRDTYVLVLFITFIASGTFLAYAGKVEPQLIMTPIVTGFLGLLASTTRGDKTEFKTQLGEFVQDRQSYPNLNNQAQKGGNP